MYASTQPAPSLELYVPYTATSTFMYDQGKDASPGSGGEIVLDFGRQYYSSTEKTWGTVPTDTTDSQGFFSNSSIETLVNSYVQGYDSTHSENVNLYIGTNNDEPNYNSASNSQTIYTNEGNSWYSLVNSISGSGLVSIEGANDIEYFGGISYANTQAWLTAFGDGSAHFLCLDYGTDVNVETSTWSAYDVYEVSYGDSAAIVAPEIYFEYTQNGSLYTDSNGLPASGNATDWENINAQYPIYFDSVSSENGAYIDGNESLTDTASWDALDVTTNSEIASILQF